MFQANAEKSRPPSGIGVGSHGGLDLGGVEMKHSPVLREHVHLLDACEPEREPGSEAAGQLGREKKIHLGSWAE